MTDEQRKLMQRAFDDLTKVYRKQQGSIDRKEQRTQPSGEAASILDRKSDNSQPFSENTP